MGIPHSSPLDKLSISHGSIKEMLYKCIFISTSHYKSANIKYFHNINWIRLLTRCCTWSKPGPEHGHELCSEHGSGGKTGPNMWFCRHVCLKLVLVSLGGCMGSITSPFETAQNNNVAYI